jgi:anti-sigma B factor antagonist
MAESSYTQSRIVNGVTVASVTLEKVTDRESQPVLHELTNASLATRHHMALDLSCVRLLASAGIGMLISLHKTCKAGDGKLVVFGLRDEIIELLRLTNLHRLVLIEPSLEAALKKASP